MCPQSMRVIVPGSTTIPVMRKAASQALGGQHSITGKELIPTLLTFIEYSVPNFFPSFLEGAWNNAKSLDAREVRSHGGI